MKVLSHRLRDVTAHTVDLTPRGGKRLLLHRAHRNKQQLLLSLTSTQIIEMCFLQTACDVFIVVQLPQNHQQLFLSRRVLTNISLIERQMHGNGLNSSRMKTKISDYRCSAIQQPPAQKTVQYMQEKHKKWLWLIWNVCFVFWLFLSSICRICFVFLMNNCLMNYCGAKSVRKKVYLCLISARYSWKSTVQYNKSTVLQYNKSSCHDSPETP